MGLGASPPPRPNVVVILADDLGYGDLSCYGHPRFKTPHLDRMAAEGARLTHFSMSAPYCAPSRAALQTGRYQFRSGMTRNPLPRTDLTGRSTTHELGLPDAEVTLGEAFQSGGYRTSFIGKWHLGHLPRFYPTRHGYDEYLGILYSNDMHRVELFDGERIVEYPVVQATLTRRYTERALAFIEANRERPFFLCLAHAMPHKPLACSEEFYEKSGDGLYADVIAELDWSVGRLLERIAELGLDEKTLVVFTSDNGPWYGGSTGGLRGMKGRTFEGGTRVPFIARWPGVIPAGTVNHAPAIVVDILPTALGVAGLPLPGDRIIDGKDILPLLRSSAAPSPHEAIFTMRGDRIATVRRGRWKLHIAAPGPRVEKVWRPDEPWTDPRAPDGVRILAPYEQAHPSAYPGARGDPVDVPALFDLEADPAEQHNVAADHPEVVAELRALHGALAAGAAKED